MARIDEQTPFITEQKNRVKTKFERKYLESFGNRQERRIDIPGLSPALIMKRQELELAQKRLEDEKVNYEHWAQEYEQRKNDINGKKREFEEEEKMHLEYNRQAQQEINRYKINIEKEYNQTVKLENELTRLNAKEQELTEKLDGLKSEIAKVKPYADFLEDIVESTKIFESPESVLSRYRSLVSTKVDWSVILHNELGIEDRFSDKKAYLQQLKTQEMERNHKLSILREEIEKEAKNKKYKQVSMMKIAERTNEKETEIATIHSAINNICRQIIQNPLQPVRSQMAKQEVPTALVDKLNVIKSRFLDLFDIVSDPEITKTVRMDDDLKDFIKTTRKLNDAQNKSPIKKLHNDPKSSPEKDVFLNENSPVQ